MEVDLPTPPLQNEENVKICELRIRPETELKNTKLHSRLQTGSWQTSDHRDQINKTQQKQAEHETEGTHLAKTRPNLSSRRERRETKQPSCGKRTLVPWMCKGFRHGMRDVSVPAAAKHQVGGGDARS